MKEKHFQKEREHDNVIGIKNVKHSNTQMCNYKNNKNKMIFQQRLNVLGAIF